jgi:chromosome partitioning protein
MPSVRGEMDPVDPKRRGRRLFGGRRRHERASEEVMSDEVTTGSVTVPTEESTSAVSTATPEASSDAGRSESVPSDDPVVVTKESDADGEESEPRIIGGESADAPASDMTPEPGQDPEPSTSEEAAPVVVNAESSEGEDAPAPSSDRSLPRVETSTTPPAVSTEAPTPGGPDSEPEIAGESTDAVDDEEEDDSYELPRITAIANQKGGVGKTTTSVNLGAALAERGYRVLVVDLDPQGNATTGLGVNARELQGSIYDVIMNDAAIEDCIEPTTLKNLFVAPATIDLAGAEIELVPAFSRELKLRRALHEIKDDYDYMIIDCPPSLGLLTVNGLAAADDVIVPIQCEYYALEGLSQLIRNVSLVQRNLNPSLDVRGIVLTMYDARTKLADQVEQEVRNHFGRTVYQTVIPRTVRLSEAPSFGQPIILFDPTSRGAVAYRELAKEVSHGATRRSG